MHTAVEGWGREACTKLYDELTHAPIEITLPTQLQKLLLGKVPLRVEPERSLDEGNEWIVCRLTESVDSWAVASLTDSMDS